MRAKFIYESLKNTVWDNGTIKLSLEDMLDYLDTSKIKTEKIKPESVKKLLIDVNRDSKKIQNADLKYPIILIKDNGKITTIIDGQHRVVKALKNKNKCIKARTIDLDKAPKKYKILFGNK